MAVERWGDRAYVANPAYPPGGGTAAWVAGLCAFADLGCKGTLYRYAGGAPVGQMTGGAVPTAAAARATLRLPDGSVRTLARFRF